MRGLGHLRAAAKPKVHWLRRILRHFLEASPVADPAASFRRSQLRRRVRLQAVAPCECWKNILAVYCKLICKSYNLSRVPTTVCHGELQMGGMNAQKFWD